MIKRMTLALAALLLGALLQTAAFAQTPQIRDVTGNWIDDEPRVLKARMLPMLAATGVRIIRVDATFARHHWPGRDQAHRRCIRSSKQRMARQSRRWGRTAG